MSVISFTASHSAWKKINYRSARQLLTAEFLHRLYGRHEPFLNSFYFADTIVTYRNGQAVSYAPTADWDAMIRRFGGAILRDPGRMLGYLAEVIARPRARTAELATRLATLQVAGLSDAALLDTLCEMQFVPLGEVYELNFVQAEFSLQAALRSILATRMPEARIGETLSSLVRSDEHTAAGRLEIHFLKWCAELHGCADEAALDSAVADLLERYAELGSGYGAETADREQIRERLGIYLTGTKSAIEDRIARLTEMPAGGEVAVRDLPRIAADLADQLRAVGDLRDRNKALIGSVSKHTPRLLTEIADRRGMPRAHLDQYLLGELCDLLEFGWRVPVEVIRRRVEEGVVLRRSEHASIGAAAHQFGSAAVDDGASANGGAVLRGLCASPGRHRGTVRVVSSARDLDRMSQGDVLVAPGTDFDMMLLLQTAGAVVVEEGGVLSHPAVISRELGIPCVLGVSDATRCLQDGETVEVDAGRGLVVRTAINQSRAATGRRPQQLIDAAQHAVPPQFLLGPQAAATPAVIGSKAANLARLAAAGLPVPPHRYVLPAQLVAQLRATGQDSRDTLPAELIAELRSVGGSQPVNLRSSSQLEDAELSSSAGMFRSRINVAASDAELRDALAEVLVTPDPGLLARYLDAEIPQAHLSVLVTQYEDFQFLGTAFSRSPFGGANPLVETFEQNRAGAAAGSGVLVECGPGGHSTPIDGYADVIGRVADLARRAEPVLGGAVELEWGARDGHVSVLQGRLVVNRAASGHLGCRA